MEMLHGYALLDSGRGRKLERFGQFVIARPCSQAIWEPQRPLSEWQKADATFMRQEDTKWTYNNDLPTSWNMSLADIEFKISPTDFGHLGIFPEQAKFWLWIQEIITKAKASGKETLQVLNLFAYSGGATLAAAKAGAQVCHLDASKGMVAWARENAALNHLEQSPIRWIVEDVSKFLQREQRRGKQYDAIILDPPSFGRGTKGEVFKIEKDLPDILKQCRELLSSKPLFVLFSCHTPGFTPIVMHHLLSKMMEDFKGRIDCGEMVLEGNAPILSVPSGTFARWVNE